MQLSLDDYAVSSNVGFCSVVSKHLPCSLKICYAVHEIIYTEQHTKLIVLCFFVCNIGRISRLWERRSPLISSSFW